MPNPGRRVPSVNRGPTDEVVAHYETVMDIVRGQYQDELARRASIQASFMPIIAVTGFIIAGLYFIFLRIPEIGEYNHSMVFGDIWVYRAIYVLYALSVISMIAAIFKIRHTLYSNDYKYLPTTDEQMPKYGELMEYYISNNLSFSNMRLDIIQNYIENMAESVALNINTNDRILWSRRVAYGFL